MVISLVNISWKPNRVIIDEEGHAVPPEQAERQGIIPDIIFIRKDGWSLGGPNDLEDITYNMWRGEWEQFARRGDKTWTDIINYKY